MKRAAISKKFAFPNLFEIGYEFFERREIWLGDVDWFIGHCFSIG